MESEDALHSDSDSSVDDILGAIKAQCPNSVVEVIKLPRKNRLDKPPNRPSRILLTDDTTAVTERDDSKPLATDSFNCNPNKDHTLSRDFNNEYQINGKPNDPMLSAFEHSIESETSVLNEKNNDVLTDGLVFEMDMFNIPENVSLTGLNTSGLLLFDAEPELGHAEDLAAIPDDISCTGENVEVMRKDNRGSKEGVIFQENSEKNEDGHQEVIVPSIVINCGKTKQKPRITGMDIADDYPTEDPDDPDDPDWAPEDNALEEDAEELRNENREGSENGIIEEDQEEIQPSTEGSGDLGIAKRKRRKVAAPQEWLDSKNKAFREKGQKYTGWTRKVLADTVKLNEQSGRVEPVSKAKRGPQREERKLGPSCQSNACIRSKLRECHRIPEDYRKELFNTFWQTLSWDQKRIYIASLVTRVEKQRTVTKKGENSRRQETIKYTLKLQDGKSVEVCKRMFLNTYGLGEWTVRSWAARSRSGNGHGMTPSRKVVAQQKRDSGVTGRIRNVEGRQVMEAFINSLPKLPSHYCRKGSSKLYLEPVFGNNWISLYEEYKRVCLGNGTNSVSPLSQCSFDKYCHEKNLAFQQPKKDKCDKCVMYEVGNLSEEEYQAHIAKKEKARLEKDADTQKAIEGKCMVVTMDVQSVKVSPSLNASALYYKTKLTCHNFTIYNNASHDTKCYWFDESQADLSANTFATCVIDYLQENCDGSMPVIIWSDGCTAQNRNSILSNALLCFSAEKKVVVEQKFLQKGHTQMEVDSIHALIERKLKNQKIHLPSDYVRISEDARKNPKIRTKMLTFDFPIDFGRKLVYDSIRPGRNKKGEPKVTNLRAIKYENGSIQVKLAFDQEYFDLPVRVKKPIPSTFDQVRTSPIKITRRKWEDLQELKNVIPVDCHSFYDLLPHH